MGCRRDVVGSGIVGVVGILCLYLALDPLLDERLEQALRIDGLAGQSRWLREKGTNRGKRVRWAGGHCRVRVRVRAGVSGWDGFGVAQVRWAGGHEDSQGEGAGAGEGEGEGEG